MEYFTLLTLITTSHQHSFAYIFVSKIYVPISIHPIEFDKNCDSAISLLETRREKVISLEIHVCGSKNFIVSISNEFWEKILRPSLKNQPSLSSFEQNNMIIWFRDSAFFIVPRKELILYMYSVSIFEYFITCAQNMIKSWFQEFHQLVKFTRNRLI